MAFTNISPTSSKSILDRYLRLTISESKTPVTYIWIDGTGEQLRSTTRTINFVARSPEELPKLSIDGFKSYQADKSYSDIDIIPVALFQDPFTPGNQLALCEAFKSSKNPLDSNQRYTCLQAIKKAKNYIPILSMKQMFTLLDAEMNPYRWTPNRLPDDPLDSHYCGVGPQHVVGRDFLEAFNKACLYAGIKMEETNSGVLPSSWEFQIGPCEGISMGDHLWVARYILQRISEEFNISVTINPKQVPSEYNVTDMITNFSTIYMREENGIFEIENAVEKLARHYRSSQFQEISTDIVKRNTFIRIPRSVADAKQGHLQDRTFLSNADPYMITEILVKALCIEK